MNNILDDDSTYEELPIKPSPPKNKLVAFLRQLFTGTGMFYVDKKSRFRWFYFITFSYALIGCLNMICWANFRIGLSFLDHFHNKVDLGAISLFTSMFIAYPIALIHLNWLINKQRSKF
jgi:hypothetical protein